MLGGLMLPALGKARTQAREVKSMSMLRNVSMAYMIYASESQDSLPTNVNDLNPYLDGGMPQSPFGPAPGGTDYWLNPRGGKMSKIADPTRYA